jgi:hypothetical protein
VKARWLRWATLEGVLLPTGEEKAKQAQQRATELEALLARYREHFGELPE